MRLFGIGNAHGSVRVRVLVRAYGTSEEMSECFPFGVRFGRVGQSAFCRIEGLTHVFNANVSRAKTTGLAHGLLDCLESSKYGFIAVASREREPHFIFD